MTVKVRFADLRQITRSRSYASVLNEQERLRQASRDLIRSVFPPRAGIRLVGVTVSNFESGEPDDLPLFSAG